MANPNFQLLVDAAKLLKPIFGEVVFVGGCTTALLITDKVAADLRTTHDVDAIAEITSYVEYAGFSEKLRGLGVCWSKAGLPHATATQSYIGVTYSR